MKSLRTILAVSSFSLVGLALACNSDDDPAPASSSDAGAQSDGRGVEQVGQACKAPVDCFPGIDSGTLKGEVQCLDRVTNGYCTHLCQSDGDCCAVPGECKTGFKQVCAPFESTGKKMCFLSCEDSDLHGGPDAGADAGTLEATLYCQAYASADFGCRSTGGGKENRKVCLPGGGTPSDSGTD